MPNTTAPNAKWLRSAVLAHLSPEKKERATRPCGLTPCSQNQPDELSRKAAALKASLSHLCQCGHCGAGAGLGAGQGFTVLHSAPYRQFLWAHTWGDTECAHPELFCMPGRELLWLVLKVVGKRGEWGKAMGVGKSKNDLVKFHKQCIRLLLTVTQGVANEGYVEQYMYTNIGAATYVNCCYWFIWQKCSRWIVSPGYFLLECCFVWSTHYTVGPKEIQLTAKKGSR